MYVKTTIRQRLEERFIRTPGGCWYWTGRVDRDGYGRIQYDGQYRPAHRVMMMTEGHVMDGLDVDHLCRRRRCVNPLHLEVVTRTENERRKRIAIGRPLRRGLGGTCVNGHQLNEENTRFSGRRRVCRACVRTRAARYRARREAA